MKSKIIPLFFLSIALLYSQGYRDKAHVLSAGSEFSNPGHKYLHHGVLGETFVTRSIEGNTYKTSMGYFPRPDDIPVTDLLSIANDSSADRKNIVLKWEKIDDYYLYDLFVSNDKNNRNELLPKKYYLKNNYYHDLLTVFNKGYHYWRVRTRSADKMDYTEWTESWRFLVGLEDFFHLKKNDVLFCSPNPLTHTANILFGLEHKHDVFLNITNSLGIEVALIIDNQYYEEGVYSVNFDASNLPTGVYFCNLRYGEKVETIKILVIK